MATTAGALSLVSKTDTTANLSSEAATGGTGPYTYQWYRSTTSGFSPGAGNIIAGATALTLADTGLIPGTNYYYKVVATDSGAVSGTSSQLAVATNAFSAPSQNAFAQGPILGQVDLPYSVGTVSAQIDSSQSGNLYPGQAVKIVDSIGGVPKVVAVTADTDEVFGFINYNFKNPYFSAGMPVEISQAGNMMYLLSTGVVARGVRVCSKNSVSIGGVGALSGSGGENIVGYAFDAASAAGQLMRVRISSPSFLADGT